MKTILGFVSEGELRDYGKTVEDDILISPGKIVKEDIFVEVTIKKVGELKFEKLPKRLPKRLPKTKGEL